MTDNFDIWDDRAHRYLTKSRFIHALDCPTKLYYKENEEYVSAEEDNEFLKTLAEGGMQVGELAQLYFPEGTLIKGKGRYKTISSAQTADYLTDEKVTLFEAAFMYEHCYVLADIVVKDGNKVDLIEVKSKSWGKKEEDETMLTNASTVRGPWQKYLYDIAFQTWVFKQVNPEMEVTPYLYLIDKERAATVEGLHQYFKIVKDMDGRSEIELTEEKPDLDLGDPIMKKIDVSEEVNLILEGKGREPESELEAQGFDAWVRGLMELYVENKKYPTEIGAKCKNCEHRVPADKLNGKTCGFRECWSEKLGWSEDDFNEPAAFDVWFADAGKYMEDEIYKMKELTPEYYGVDESDLYSRPKWDNGYKDRQVVQIMKQTGRHEADEVILPGLYEEMKSWTYPLNFIDFEGIAPAIPFHKGAYPYKKTPFQFSVHKVHENGSVEHAAEWVEKEKGAYPCFTFVRKLKEVLDQDEGSVFMYHHYERSTLRDVRDALERSEEPDREELIDWINTLVTEGSPRYMIDQQQLVRYYHYSVHMGKSISIKDVLPAILQESEVLKDIYSQPYNGLSIKDTVLYQEDGSGKVINPYKQLPEVGYGIPDVMHEDEVKFEGSERIVDGGAAMMAWARMQFPDVSEAEREAVFKSLLQYCELDTLAMVMIYQHWKSKK
ncbi:DUF2779 domain-containing protein [Balneola sp. MJW-20]|uniref:DUF2779 domain-containing protein n=1 Tax=Gracilimonas aurantiaca TaxID=3234185 RepID=UPI0034656A46